MKMADFIMLDIKPVFITGFNCMENSLSSILKWKLIDCEKSYIGSWKFKIIRGGNEKLLGNRIYTETLKETAEKYKKYCGVDYKIYDKESVKNPFDLIKCEISKGMPLLIITDIYYCPWSEFYHKGHNEHFLTVVEIDDECVFSIDSAPLEQNGVVKKEEFLKGLKSLITLKIDGANSEISDLKTVLREIINETGSDMFNDLRYFADCIEGIDLKAETEGFLDIWNIPLFSNILSIYGSRYKIKEYIKYLQRFFDEDILKYLHAQFKEILLDWALIKALLCKIIVAKDGSLLSNFFEKIRAVAQKEEDAASAIHDYLNKKFELKEKTTEKPLQSKNYTFADIRKYFNNKGFEGKNASLSRSGQYFLKKGLPKESIWNVDGAKYKFPDLENSEYDNISCKGQKIYCTGVYSRMMILYCSEWGSYIENIVVNYKGGLHEKLDFAASDWYKEPEFQETIAWSGEATSKSQKTSDICNIYTRSLEFNKSRKEIESITLPNCENIHIFAITFA